MLSYTDLISLAFRWACTLGIAVVGPGLNYRTFFISALCSLSIYLIPCFVALCSAIEYLLIVVFHLKN